MKKYLNNGYLDEKKVLDYLKQFDNEEISSTLFMNDDEGWGEFIRGVDVGIIEEISDEEFEDVIRMEMSFYYYSDGDSI